MHSVEKNNANCNPTTSEEEIELRRGPWTLEEDTLLIHYISRHGEGHWNLLAKRAGLKRTGKSCRLRWLNYLKPDIKRGNLTPQEQLLILELHSKWGNRWSKIAQHLPGRTDNEIKNYWRTRVQKQARQLNIESNSKRFIDAVRCFWMPRLLQKVEQSSSSSNSSSSTTLVPSCDQNYETLINNINPSVSQYQVVSNSPQSSINPQNKDSPISIHPKGYLNSFTDHTFSFLTPQIEQQYPKMCTISDPYAFENRAQNIASNNINNIPSPDFVDHFDGITTATNNNNNNNFNIINSVHYVDMLSGSTSVCEIESGLNLDPISGTEPYSFDIPGLNCHMAACDWTMDDTLWNMGEM